MSGAVWKLVLCDWQLVRGEGGDEGQGEGEGEGEGESESESARG